MFLVWVFLRVYHVKTETIVKLYVKNWRQHPCKNFYPFKAPVFPNHLIIIIVQDTKVHVCGNGFKKKYKIDENLSDILDAE